jgi:hypothetical protein
MITLVGPTGKRFAGRLLVNLVLRRRVRSGVSALEN